MSVSTHSRLKAAVAAAQAYFAKLAVSTHSRLKAAAGAKKVLYHAKPAVSTHSRLKTAGRQKGKSPQRCRFNTQPPEDGCFVISFSGVPCDVSTHSRLKTAARVRNLPS